MENQRLRLYHVHMKYIRNLANVDKRVMSVSPQTKKQERVFVGIVIMLDQHQYCIPLTSNKEKIKNMRENITLRKIRDRRGEVIAALNLNNMIPVREEYLIPYDLKILPGDAEQDRRRKIFCQKELEWCRKNHEEIERLARRLHDLYFSEAEFQKKKICLDFPRLERECDKGKKIK